MAARKQHKVEVNILLLDDPPLLLQFPARQISVVACTARKGDILCFKEHNKENRTQHS
jgi:hypothetical protein